MCTHYELAIWWADWLLEGKRKWRPWWNLGLSMLSDGYCAVIRAESPTFSWVSKGVVAGWWVHWWTAVVWLKETFKQRAYNASRIRHVIDRPRRFLLSHSQPESTHDMADSGTCVDCHPQPPGISVVESQVKQHDPLDPTTFVPPSPLPGPSVIVEFCDRVSTWKPYAAKAR